MTEEKLVLQWWNGFYALGWRGNLALWLLRPEVEAIAKYFPPNTVLGEDKEN